MTREATQLIVGRGELYFDQFAPSTRVGQGELYLGNTPSLTVSRAVVTLQQFVSYQGQKVEKEGTDVQDTHSVSFTTDNISLENMAAFYGVDYASASQTSGGPATESFEVKPDAWLQLGKSQRVQGLRAVTGVVVKKGVATIAASGNYETDPALGRVHILIDAVDIDKGDTLDITFSWSASAQSLIIPSKRNLLGSMRYISNSPYGPKYNWYFPLVRLKGSGSIDLKSDEWQQVGFMADVFRLNPATEYTYVEKIS